MWGRLKGLEGQDIQGSREGGPGAKPPGHWRIFEKINENSNEKFIKFWALLGKIPIFFGPEGVRGLSPRTLEKF